jgi:hypothetical protein
MNPEVRKRYKDINFPFICPVTNRKFDTSQGLSCYVTKTLKIKHAEYYDTYINHRDPSCFFCGNKGTFITISKGYRNLCESQECVKKSFNSNSVEGIMYSKMCSRKEAELLFIQQTQTLLEKRTKTQNELRSKDPLWDKKRSRNCKEFWIKKGMSEEDAVKKAAESMDDIHKKTYKKFKENPEKYASKYPTKIEYYLKKGYSKEEAVLKISERQKTFSLEKCIKKYGKIDGTKKWQERQDKWMNSLNSKSEEEKIKINRKRLNGCSYSMISQKLCWDIYNVFINERIKFKKLNDEFFLLDSNKNWFAYDFVNIDRKKCIEFNGDFWHCNPKMYTSEYFHRIKKMTSNDIWKNDEYKKKLIESIGYEVLVVWESDYRKNPKEVLQKCIDFLFS